MSHRALIAIAVLAVAGDARAEDWDGSYVYGANLETIGGNFYSGMYMQVQLGRRITERFAVTASGELASATEDEIQGGIMRGLVGVEVRVVNATKTFMPSLLTSIGTGTETIAWDRGTVTRATSYVGIEYRSGFEIEKGGFIRGIRSMGFRFGIRGQVAPGVAGSTVAKLCTACEQMEPASPGVDLGLAIYMGLVFGR